MLPLILEVPYSRSTKVIGTSTTRIPELTVRRAMSTWKQYPCEATLCSSRARSVLARNTR